MWIQLDRLLRPVIPDLVAAEEEAPLNCTDQAVRGVDEKDVHESFEETHSVISIGYDAGAEIEDHTQET